jgi:hypothetical protein
LFTWALVAALPNIYTDDVFDGDGIAVTSLSDPCVRDIIVAKPHVSQFLQRFQDALNVSLRPALLIVRDDVERKLRDSDGITSFRNLLSACIIPYSRLQNVVYKSHGHRVYYSTSFWLYPWVLRDTKGHMAALTPALGALHFVKGFHGQSNPEVPVEQLSRFVPGPTSF